MLRRCHRIEKGEDTLHITRQREEGAVGCYEIIEASFRLQRESGTTKACAYRQEAAREPPLRFLVQDIRSHHISGNQYLSIGDEIL
jgi:hypothetical protein